MPRRVFALLTMLVMLHLTFVGADVACAEQGHHAAMAGMSGASASGSAGGHHSNHDGAPAPCDTPAAAHCCDATVSCGIVALAASSGETVAIAAAEQVLAPATQDLLSRALGPEPPPPRA